MLSGYSSSVKSIDIDNLMCFFTWFKSSISVVADSVLVFSYFQKENYRNSAFIIG